MFGQRLQGAFATKNCQNKAFSSQTVMVNVADEDGSATTQPFLQEEEEEDDGPKVVNPFIIDDKTDNTPRHVPFFGDAHQQITLEYASIFNKGEFVAYFTPNKTRPAF